MSLEAILAVIEASGETEIAQLRAAATARAEKILAEAAQEAQLKHEAARREAMLPIPAERARILHQAKMEAAQALGNARRHLVETTLNEVRCRLATARADQGYAATLRRLAEEALQHLHAIEDHDGPPVLEVDRRDAALLPALLPAKAVLKASLKTWGGVVAHTADDSLAVSNTLEARLERALPFVRALIEKAADA